MVGSEGKAADTQRDATVAAAIKVAAARLSRFSNPQEQEVQPRARHASEARRSWEKMMTSGLEGDQVTQPRSPKLAQ